ncbi:Msm operon regulatory protein [Clostridium polyendosporum]|uniref:Msm operon regulatory protein n=1 Tax=Clostridium polyendosporum TaxID=69208 RepID=A0A919S0J0_9CLOT|nr:AraC family transcriptional regulator [Clostridium polyendosporum]GIM30005.1 Msm operon regulatory protein [Clostridium polyendosporum]
MICFKPKNENINLELNLDIKLYYCGTGDCENDFSWGPGIKDHYKLHYVHSGRGIFKAGDTIYHLSKGDVFLICPNVLVSYKPASEEPWNYSWVAFNGVNAETYLNRANLNSNNPVFKCTQEDHINNCFQDIFDATKCEKSMDLKSLSSFYNLLSILVEETKVDTTGKNSTKHQETYIKQAIEFIDTNYSRKISIEEIASYVGINRKYLSQLFSDILNVSPQNYLINFRLQKACDLLTSSSLSINEISNSIGYNDPFLFSKIFKKHKEVSPKVYRINSVKTP